MSHSPFAMDLASADRCSGPLTCLFGHPRHACAGIFFVDARNLFVQVLLSSGFRSRRKLSPEFSGQMATKFNFVYAPGAGAESIWCRCRRKVTARLISTGCLARSAYSWARLVNMRASSDRLRVKAFSPAMTQAVART